MSLANNIQNLRNVISSLEGKASGGEDYWQYVDSLVYAFACSNWDGEKVLEINVPNISGRLEYVVQDVIGLRKLKMKGNTANNALTITYAFYNKTLEEIDLTEFGNGGLKFKTFKGLVYGCTKLKYIYGELDCSELTTAIEVPFTYANSLIEVRFKERTIPKSLAMGDCPNLSTASIQSIVDGLADLTGQTAQTLTLHATVGAKLTEAQKSAIAAKNWTLVY